MKAIEVDLAERSYPIYIGKSVLSDKALFEQHVTSNQVLIVTNETVAALYLSQIESHLSNVNYEALILPDGETYKSLDSFNQIISRLMEKKYSRTCILIALGGGVIGDLTGFAAACYQRGVKFIQVPTTLLAQVDSSVGGKTAVNHPLGKNMIGAFHQPVAVFADTEVLSTLPDRELSAGLAEVIKYGIIRDIEFYDWLEENIELVRKRDDDALEYIINRSCVNKAEVVAEDERESGIRAILNLGHTFGHAIETALSYKEWLHGEAVGCGMLMAADLSMRLGLIEEAKVDRIRSLLERTNLPTQIHKDVSLEQMLENMKVDKKSRDGVLYLILLNDIGNVFVTSDYTEQALKETINHFLS
ncbi:MAG TPA: 3-dehydroquinate synthase [Thiotrichaceae bacterium]|jgi:3-dehydroquinate synthase|nr:3-dehydroquinate synthase [Thiotrichaceae bacterium]HIM07301.1 3-dehydroquinate synthase [Gammaproteobacteria bacterium]